MARKMQSLWVTKSESCREEMYNLGEFVNKTFMFNISTVKQITLIGDYWLMSISVYFPLLICFLFSFAFVLDVTKHDTNEISKQ